MPPEWAEHAAVWTAWPSHASLWRSDLEPARAEFVELCRAIADPAGAAVAPERLKVLVVDERGREEAVARLDGVEADLVRMSFGDIWLRDTGPVFVTNEEGRTAAVRFGFNGWGGKYRLPGDDEVAPRIAASVGVETFRVPLMLEGGAIEVDGQGTALTTRQCALNVNRNPLITQEMVEEMLRNYLGIDRLLWLDSGLAEDHTDGHVDTLARFAGPGRVLCMEPRASDDPNASVLTTIRNDLGRLWDARGRRLEVVTVPSPGAILTDDGALMPASYLNYYVANAAVVVPVYGSAYDAEAVETIAACFPDRRTVPVSARSILSGGGAFHCITQQQPRILAPVSNTPPIGAERKQTKRAVR